MTISFALSKFESADLSLGYGKETANRLAMSFI